MVGGPMKGNAQFTGETPLTKSSHGIFLVPREAIPEEVNLTCINCGRCTRACPVRLQVHLIGRYVEHGLLAESKAFHPEACNACGLCTYVCPAHRPLVQLIKMSNQYDRIEL
jgi:electron transport complex protein RnfC